MINKLVKSYKLYKYKIVLSVFVFASVICVAAGLFIWQVAKAKSRQDVITRNSKNTITAKKIAENKPAEPTTPSTETVPVVTSEPEVPSTQTQSQVSVKPASVPYRAPVYTAPAPVYSPPANASNLESILNGLINGERSRVGVGTLSSVGTLQSAARQRAAEEAILSLVGIDHSRPDGRSYETAYAEYGYSGYTAWGENLAYGYKSQGSFTDQQLAEQIFTGWKNSPGHYENMIRGTYNQTGISVNMIYQDGRAYYFAAQEFARR